MEKSNKEQVLSLQVSDGLSVTIIPNANHEFLMPSKQVANGFGVGIDTIRRHKKDHLDELFEGKHFLSSVSIPHAASAGASKGTMWTKRGIVRLGFFIKSKQARLFRDWAEDLVINRLQLKQKQNENAGFEPTKQLVADAAVICGSYSRLAKRLGISNSTFSHLNKRPWLISSERIQAIEKGCRNLINNGYNTDVEALRALIQIESSEARILLFNKMQKGGLL